MLTHTHSHTHTNTHTPCLGNGAFPGANWTASLLSQQQKRINWEVLQVLSVCTQAWQGASTWGCLWGVLPGLEQGRHPARLWSGCRLPRAMVGSHIAGPSIVNCRWTGRVTFPTSKGNHTLFLLRLRNNPPVQDGYSCICLCLFGHLLFA